MIEFAISTDSLERLRARLSQAPAIVREELQSGTIQATDEGRDEVKRRTPLGPGDGPHTRDQVVSRFEQVGTGEFRGVVTVLDVGHARPVMRYLDEGTRAHPIEAQFTKALRFTVAGSVLFRRKVMHPGTAPLRIFSGTREAMAGRVRRIYSARLANVTKRLRGNA